MSNFKKYLEIIQEMKLPNLGEKGSILSSAKMFSKDSDEYTKKAYKQVKDLYDFVEKIQAKYNFDIQAFKKYHSFLKQNRYELNDSLQNIKKINDYNEQNEKERDVIESYFLNKKNAMLNFIDNISNQDFYENKIGKNPNHIFLNNINSLKSSLSIKNAKDYQEIEEIKKIIKQIEEKAKNHFLGEDRVKNISFEDLQELSINRPFIDNHLPRYSQYVDSYVLNVCDPNVFRILKAFFFPTQEKPKTTDSPLQKNKTETIKQNYEKFIGNIKDTYFSILYNSKLSYGSKDFHDWLHGVIESYDRKSLKNEILISKNNQKAGKRLNKFSDNT
jgi:hypothetical protein